MKLLIAIALLLSGCGKGLDSAPITPGEFRAYFEAFDAAAEQRNSSVRALDRIRIEFAASDSAEHEGECHKDDLRGRWITIDPDAWAVLTSADRESLIFHELGHCVLNREHSNETIDLSGDFISQSLMNMHRVEGTLFDDYKDYYLKELFN